MECKRGRERGKDKQGEKQREEQEGENHIWKSKRERTIRGEKEEEIQKGRKRWREGRNTDDEVEEVDQTIRVGKMSGKLIEWEMGR